MRLGLGRRWMIGRRASVESGMSRRAFLEYRLGISSFRVTKTLLLCTGDGECRDEKVGMEVLFGDGAQAPPSPCPRMLGILGIPLHTMPCVTAGAGFVTPSCLVSFQTFWNASAHPWPILPHIPHLWRYAAAPWHSGYRTPSTTHLGSKTNLGRSTFGFDECFLHDWPSIKRCNDRRLLWSRDDH